MWVKRQHHGALLCQVVTIQLELCQSLALTVASAAAMAALAPRRLREWSLSALSHFLNCAPASSLLCTTDKHCHDYLDPSTVWALASCELALVKDRSIARVSMRCPTHLLVSLQLGDLQQEVGFGAPRGLQLGLDRGQPGSQRLLLLPRLLQVLSERSIRRLVPLGGLDA